MEAERRTYLLGQRFSMPVENGTRDAIAVSFDTGKKLLSAYTLMVDLILLQIWSLIVLAAISIYMRKAHSPNTGAASAAIWNSQGSAFSVFTMMAKYLVYMKRNRERGFALAWMAAAASCIALAYAISILVPRFLILGNGAPVDSKSIFVPDTNETTSRNPKLYEWNFLVTPSSLRAAGGVNETTLQKVKMKEPEETSGVNGTVKRVGYAYTITGADFGLQHAPDLRLEVEGSCVTEYSWLDLSDDSNELIVDDYKIFRDDSKAVSNRSLSLYDGRPPIAYFHPGSQNSKIRTNNTFAIAVSSVQRTSYTAGTDPLYATKKAFENPATEPQYEVMSKRPILSCWQNDVWVNKDKQGSIFDLSTLPGLNMPEKMATLLLERFLGIPVIVTLGSRLGNRAIQSSATSKEQIFDAAGSSMVKDLHYLVAAAYIASIRTLPETTMINSTTFTNLAVDPATGKLYAELADFVVYSRDIATISLKVLIIVPVVLVVLFVIVVILTNSPASWNKAQALRATILYSCLDEKTDDGGGKWDRSSEIAHHLDSEVERHAVLRPEFQKEQGLFWVRAND